MLTFAKEFNTPEPILREMYWYDVMLIIKRYNEIMEENETKTNNSAYDEQIKAQHQNYTDAIKNMKAPNLNSSNFNINSITSGIKMPKI